MRAAVYTRISLDRTGQALGVARQLQDCEALAKRLGWTVAERFADNDISAYSGKVRPGFEALLDGLKRGEYDALICWHPDRLYRKLKDLVRLLDVAGGVDIRTVQGGEMDLSTSTGRMLATIVGAASTAEVEQGSERKRRAAKQLAERGVPKWRRAFGYLDGGGDRRDLDPEVAPLIRQAYAAVIAGSSLADVCRLWNDAGALTGNGKPWTQPQVSTFLRKPRNAGLRTYQAGRGRADRDDVIGKGCWPPIVDEDTFWTAQAVLDAPGRAPGRKTVRKHLLTGVLRCGRVGCGGYLSGQWVMQAQKDGPRSHAITYACKSCRGCSIRAEHVEPLIYRVIAGRLARADAVDLLKAELHDVAEAEALRIEANTLLSRLDEIADERADGLLTGAQARRATDRIQEKLDAIERRQQDAERLRGFDGIPLGKPEVVDAIKELSPDRLRAVIDVLVEFVVAGIGKGGNTFRPERVAVNWR
jgi:DNA invertase Pin-like site-specific DNA recombinase